MKKTLKTILIVVALVLAISVFTACELLDKINNSLEHTGGHASCTEQAICEDCGIPYGEKLPHVKETTPAKAPTCTEPGYSASVVCKNCGEVLTEAVEIAAVGHSYNAVVTAPTCTEKGYTTYTCTCGDSYVTDEVAALGHKHEATVTAPTCTEKGYTTYTCACGDSYVTDEVAALGHKHEATVTAPTCTEEGYTTYTCACGDSYVADKVDALKHNIIIDKAVDPTCTATGLTAGEHCSRCDYKVAQVEVAALGHDIIVDKAVDATCEGTGLTAGEHCSRCDYKVDQQETAALGHAWENGECTRCEAAIPVLSYTDSFDFTTEAGLNAALESGNLGYTGAFRNNGDSHQFDANSSIQFRVPANTTVTIVGHSTGYGVFDVYVNGEKMAMAGTLTFTVSVEATVVIVPNEEATHSKAYLKGITLSEYVDRTIVEDTTITFGSEGNYRDSIVDFSGIEIRDNGGNNAQIKNGSFELILKAGSKVVIHGYSGYTSYSLNGGEEITGEWYTYIALEDTVLTVTPVNGNNYFYSIEITLHEGVRLVEAKDPTCTEAGHGAHYACDCHNEPLTDKGEIAALGHTAGAEATCTTAQTCTVCGEELVAALGHNWSDWVITKNPTATTAGEEKRTCANGCEEKRELLFTLYFKPNSNWKQSGARYAAYFFGSKGNTWVSMTDTDGDGVYEVKAPLGYENVIFCRMNPNASANNWNNKWNQTGDLKIPTDGKNYFTLPNNVWDGATTSWSKLTCVHDTVEGSRVVVTEPTCEGKGLATATCKKCGIYEEKIAPLGHKFDSTHKCTACGVQASFTVAGTGAHLGKEWAPEYTANDMTYDAETGVYTKIYENVAAGTYKFKVARDHSWNVAYPGSDKSYTVATDGSTVIITLKGTTVTVDVKASHTHSYEAVVTAPTCTEAGYTTYTCACGDTYTGDEVAATGHVDAEPCDHECDNCGLCVSECADENKDHKCDVCKDVMSKCADNDQNHFCDYCGIQNSHCIDIDDDHKCNWCGKIVAGVCVDEDPRDHECDVCGNCVSDCADENKDHKCDVCKDVMSKCADNDQNHFCDYCGIQNSHCIDIDDDHKCNWCGKIVAGVCVDEDPRDHECDVCGNCVSDCADENKDHKCDVCKDVMSKCADNDQNHFCDYCGIQNSHCIDIDDDHKCNWCGKIVAGLCVDEDPCDHECDVCGNVSECADENGDYMCDICEAKMLPADGTTLTIPQALAIAKLAGTSYTTQKYYITGIVTNVYNTTYGNLYLKDADGNQICIYGLYTWNKAVRYDKMDYKPVEGDELTVYTVLGMYGTTAQGKDAWMNEVVAHAHDYKSVVTDPGCLTEGYTTYTCSICNASYVDNHVEALGHTTDNGECERCGQTIGGAPVVGTLAEFTFGADGKETHVDGNDYGTSKSFTVGTYTLTLQSMSKVYGPAYDAKGNSCIKLGTSKVVGKFSFTVPENVTEVVIYVAQYKANTTKIKVNGTAYTITTASNNGAYTAIKIDTTTTKTITFETVSGGVRCMINTIVFNGYAQ